MKPLILLIIALAGLARAAGDAREFPPVVEQVTGGRIDWTELRLEVTSRSDRTVGAWKDRRVQEQDAVTSLAPRIIALAERVPITPESRAGELMQQDADLGRRLAQSLGDWRIEETRYHTSGGVEMDASLDLRTWLRPALVALASPEPASPEADGPSGIVVDARGLPFSPSLAPTVLSADGVAVIRAQLLSAEAARLRSPVLYVGDPADPRAARRAGEQPIFLRASAIQAGALILAPAAEGLELSSTRALVASGRVVVVVDPP